MKNYSTFNKLILHTAEAYLTKAYEEGMTKEPMHIKLLSGLRAFQTFGKFSAEEAKLLQSFSQDPILERIKNQEISYVIYALSLLKFWVEEVPLKARKHIHLGVGNKKLLMGASAFAIFMLKQKRQDETIYKEKKQIINKSVLNARHYFSFFEENLTKETR